MRSYNLRKRVLVTGGAGFLGSHLCERLLADRCDVLCVDDLIGGLVRLMNAPDDFTGPVNLGNPHEFTILDLARKVIELTNSRSDIVFKPLPSDDPTQRQPDISLAKNRLGWGSAVPLVAGLRQTIDYFRGERG